MIKKDFIGYPIWTLLGPQKKRMLALLILITLSGFFESIGIAMVMPLFGIITGGMVKSGDNYFSIYTGKLLSSIFSEDFKIFGICLVFFLIFLIKNIVFFLKAIYGENIVNCLRKYWVISMLDKYIHADYKFLITEKRGTLIYNIYQETIATTKFYSKFIVFIAKIINGLCVYIMMLIVSCRFTLLLTLMAVTLSILYYKLNKATVATVSKKRLGILQKITDNGTKALNFIKQIKLFSGETKVITHTSSLFDKLNKMLLKLNAIQNIPMPFGELLVVSGFIAGLLYFEYVKKIPLVSVLPFMIFAIISCEKLFSNWSNIVSDFIWFQAYLPSISLINSIVHTDDIKREDLSSGEQICRLKGDIVFKDLSFSYDGNNYVFSNLNICIQKNKTTALIGNSGSGKSTLVDLLSCFYKTYKGEIICGDIELKKLNPTAWRKMIGFISQDTYLFNGSIRENILFGRPDATESEMINCAKKANAHNFILELHNGYETEVGEGGMKISGGQRQRISIARALIRDPEILIFDEPTSSLDEKTEELFRETLEELKGKKTIIIISHRNSILKNVDTFYLIEGGEGREYYPNP